MGKVSVAGAVVRGFRACGRDGSGKTVLLYFRRPQKAAENTNKKHLFLFGASILNRKFSYAGRKESIAENGD